MSVELTFALDKEPYLVIKADGGLWLHGRDVETTSEEKAACLKFLSVLQGKMGLPHEGHARIDGRLSTESRETPSARTPDLPSSSESDQPAVLTKRAGRRATSPVEHSPGSSQES